MVPCSVPATPAAQPYGAPPPDYKPTPVDRRVAELCDYHNCGLFVVSGLIASVISTDPKNVH